MTSENQKQYTLFDHLLELRSRLLKAVISVLVVFCCLAYFAQELRMQDVYLI